MIIIIVIIYECYTKILTPVFDQFNLTDTILSFVSRLKPNHVQSKTLLTNNANFECVESNPKFQFHFSPFR